MLHSSRSFAKSWIVARFFAFLAVGTALISPAFGKAPAPSKRMVFAHYMVCCPTAGGSARVDDFENEIREAQKRGVDGFALNCGGWTRSEPFYKRRTEMMYEAAKRLGTHFQLMISGDYCCGLSMEETRDMIESFYDHPNQFRYEGEPVFTTFAGDLTPKLAETVQSGAKPAVFVPYFYPRPVASEHPSPADVDQVFRDFPTLDGFFYFGAAGTGAQIAESDHLLAKKWIGARRIFMASVTPYYRGLKGNYRTFGIRGFEDMAREWETAIRDDATWVEIVTWNDWGEDSYVAPFGSPGETHFQSDHWGSLLSHAAFLDASRYYIDWYKSGAKHRIVKDRLYYFYRTHPKALEAVIDPEQPEKKGRPAGAECLEDRVYVSLFLTAPARLTIISGERTATMDAKAGVSHVSAPFAQGAQRFILRRGNRALIDQRGERDISATDSSSNFNYFSGGAAAKE